MFDRRQMLRVSGAALAAGVAGCTPKAQESASASAPAPPSPAATPAPPTAAQSAEIDEAVRDSLAQSLSEPGGATASSPSGLVTSFAELEANPDLLENVQTVMQKVARREITAIPVADEDSVDYSCLVRQKELGADAAMSNVPFVLNSDVLKSVAGAAGYLEALATETAVLFGLRGCVLADGPTKGISVRVREATVNHVDRMCVLGIWRPATGELAVFEGSTVPNLVNMQMHIFWQFAVSKGIKKVEEIMCGQFPAGLHTYRVGTHLQSSSDVARRHPGAFLQVSKSPVIRARSDLRYRWDEMWDPLLFRPPGVSSDRSVRVTGCNIHAAVNRSVPKFNSQGTQTIDGFYQPKGIKPAGPWADFQRELGIEIVADGSAYKSNKDGAQYKYMLLTGREARLHAEYAGKPDGLKRLQRVRIGTTGPVAAALRKTIGYKAGDVVDGDVMNELLRYQGSIGVPLDGVVTPTLSEDLGLKLFS